MTRSDVRAVRCEKRRKSIQQASMSVNEVKKDGGKIEGRKGGWDGIIEQGIGREG